MENVLRSMLYLVVLDSKQYKFNKTYNKTEVANVDMSYVVLFLTDRFCNPSSAKDLFSEIMLLSV
jgi:hypothetical protein